MFGKLKSLFRPRTPPVGKFQRVSARFDAAQTTKDNVRHWSMADYCSADQEAKPEIRRILRQRSRYEIANNSYAKGLVQMLANDTIGTGPRIQLLTEDEAYNEEIEAEFKQKLPDFFPEGKKTSITFSPLIFDARSFPLEKKEARCLPPECKQIHEAFVQWYKQQHPKTQLILLADLSVVESKFHVPKNTKAPLARTYTVSSDLLCASIMDAVSQKQLSQWT